MDGPDTEIHDLVLDNNTVVRYSMRFYFPKPGRFSLFPPHVARDGAVLAYAQPIQLDVVETLEAEIDTRQWADVCQACATLLLVEGNSSGHGCLKNQRSKRLPWWIETAEWGVKSRVKPRPLPPHTQRGSADAVVAYLRANDLPRDTELEQLAWRMMDKAFYVQVIAALRSRMVFFRPLWAFALYHQYVPNCRIAGGICPLFA
jgi:hypothetical protein